MQPSPTCRLPQLLRMPWFVRFGIHIDSASAWLWLALLVLALWPTWWWLGQHIADNKNSPLGALALATLAAVLWRHRRRLRATPRLGFQSIALAGAVFTTALHNQMPDMLLVSMGALSLAAGLIAFLPAHVATAPVLGLSLLSLPLQASLPLPQLVWWGCFTACVTALASGNSDRDFLLSLPLVSVLVWFGSVLQDSSLSALQAHGTQVPHWTLSAVDLLVLITISASIAAAVRTTTRAGASTP